MIYIDHQNAESQLRLQELNANRSEYIYFKYLDWDSAFFGRPSFLLDVSKSNFNPSDILCSQIRKSFDGAFVTAKIDTQYDYEITYFLQKCGFYYVDTEVKLQNIGLPASPAYDNRIRISELSNEDNLPLDELGKAFSLTRFHCDPHIDEVKADELWVSYIKNFKPSESKRMFIARFGNEIAGAVIVNITKVEVFLFFVAVIEKYRGKSIGSATIETILGGLNLSLPICTGTQAKNISAINFYIKNGFSRVVQTNTVLHYWG